jgi:hypothetical protein
VWAPYISNLVPGLVLFHSVVSFSTILLLDSSFVIRLTPKKKGHTCLIHKRPSRFIGRF